MSLSNSSPRRGVSVGVTVLLLVTGAACLGFRGLVIAAAGAFLLLAWRHDNSAGLLFPIAILIVITFAVLVLLLYLMARMHS